MGKAWTWILDIFCFFLGDDYKTNLLKETLQKTQTVFKEKSTAIQGHIDKYKEYLRAAMDGSEIKEEDYHEARKSISDWNLNASPFALLVQEKNNGKLTELLKDNYQLENAEEPFAFKKQDFSTENLQKIIDLEGYLQGPLPLNLLKKLATDIKLEEGEEKSLKRWIKKINKTSELEAEFFHNSLAAFIEYISATIQDSNLMALELALSNYGCTIFERSSPAYEKYRDELKTEETIHCNGTEIKLGDKLQFNFTDVDRHIVFTVADNPAEVIVFGINTTIVAIEWKRIQMQGCGTFFPECIDIDEEKGFARVERCIKSIDRIEWRSSETELLHDDKCNAKPIAALMKYWIDNKISLQNMDPKNFWFGRDNVLKFIKMTFPENIDFIALEDFAINCSKDNVAVFKYLCEQSTLLEQHHFKLYKTMIHNALTKQEKDANKVAALLQIDNTKICKRAQKLHDKIKSLKNDCCTTISKNYSVDTEVLPKKVIKAINSFYKETNSWCVVWPDLKQIIIDRIVNDLQLVEKSDSPY